MALQRKTDIPWIFVSHASPDLPVVRKVRNYLESIGGAPLLFHLVSLKRAEEFWPVIEAEIRERKFFLYCDSAAARESSWVRQERAVIDDMQNNEVPVRVENVDVSTEDFDKETLDNFIPNTRVFFVWSKEDKERVRPFYMALRPHFEIWWDDLVTVGGLHRQKVMSGLGADALKRGWVVAFISSNSLRSHTFQHEIMEALNQKSDIVPVFLESPQALLSAGVPNVARFMSYQGVRADQSYNAFHATHMLLRRLMK